MPVSLLGKWMPSENASSHETKAQARKIAAAWNLKPSQYRKQIVALRKHIKLLEQRMSAKQWGEVEYDKLPSQALRKHTKAFHRHDEPRFQGYLDAAQKGEKKMNTATLYTYEVYKAVGTDPTAADAMWVNLPDYTNGQNALVMADVSGSMYGFPISLSVSLALYFAERNQGAFNGYFMTFSARPQLVKIVGQTLSQKMANIERAHWDMNTDIHAAFKAILKAAVDAKAPQDELPSVLYVISDMQFDACVDNSKTNYDQAKADFAAAGYKLPHVVFWQVNANRGNDAPATMFDNDVTLISGASQSTFRYALAGKSPLESMHEILDSERYQPVEAVVT